MTFRLAVDGSSKHGRLSELWSGWVEGSLLNAKSADKRKIGSSLVPYALAAAKSAKDVDVVLTRDRFKRFTKTGLRAKEVRRRGMAGGPPQKNLIQGS